MPSNLITELQALIKSYFESDNEHSTHTHTDTHSLTSLTSLTTMADRQNRVGSKIGSAGVAGSSEGNVDRRERLRKLALETIGQFFSCTTTTQLFFMKCVCVWHSSFLGLAHTHNTYTHPWPY